MKQLLKIIILFFVLIPAEVTFATAQYGDRLVIGNDTVWIDSNPLEVYFEKKGVRSIGDIEMDGNYCTALWRGYVATWKLENDSLYLTRIQTDYCGDHPKELDISKEFSADKVFANWVTQTIVRPKGKLLQYVHMGYMSIYESNVFYNFKLGKLTDTRTENYVETNKGQVFPGEDFLRDTIRSIILRSIDSTERSAFEDVSTCTLQIEFNPNRMLSKISLGYGKQEPATIIEKIILDKAVKALAHFPKLMKVNHNNFHMPIVNLWFSAHCLKFPYDKAYGCTYE